MLKACVSGLLLGTALSLSAHAADVHYHPKSSAKLVKEMKQSADASVQPVKPGWPGPCEIEIVNQRYQDVIVSGSFEDGAPLTPFVFYSYSAPHYISLVYRDPNGLVTCHGSMYLNVVDYYNMPLISGYAYRDSTIFIR